MSFRTYSALLLLLTACATTEPRPSAPPAPNPRIANLQRAAALPWRDDGRCVVQEASQPWPVVVERCFHALDTQRVRFNDTGEVCPVAFTGAVAVPTMVGICLLSQPYLAVGAVVVIGVVVVAVVIAEELKAHERMRRAHPETEDSSKAEESGRDGFPPEPPESLAPRERPECTPRRVPPKGGHPLHNACADSVPLNAFRGANALVNGKAFDALQPPTRTLWEIKTDDFDTYTVALRDIVIRKQVRELQRERDLARACGFDFRVGVRSAAHQAALELAAPALEGLIVVMDWC